MKRVSRSARGLVLGMGVLLVAVLLSPALAAEQPLKIIAASWGKGDRRADVTQRLRAWVRDGRLEFEVGSNQLGDPIFGTVKDLVIVYELNGVRKTQWYREGDHVSLGAPLRTPAPSLDVNRKDEQKQSPPAKVGVRSTPDDLEIPGPGAPIKRQQTEIKALFVEEQESGEMLGLTQDLILTAQPGSPRGHTPVVFVSPVGEQMTAVLDDVLRGIHVKYPKWQSSKVELSFEDRYTPKDGGSIGAAIGTLMLSMLEGFEIDPATAITGDVTADQKVRRIGGVAAKIRGATASGCRVVLLPAENLEQVVDAMIYEGPSLVTNVQVIGISTLDEAAAAARKDRDEKLNQAIDAFGSLALVLKKAPERVHAKDTQQKLQRVLDLVPNHVSAKLLLEVAQNRQRRTMSATASMYYTAVAIHDALPALFDQAQSGVRQSVTPTVVQEGMINLRKLRNRIDPKVLPLVDAMSDFIWTLNAINSGRRAPTELEPKRQRVLDALTKLEADRALMEKMLHEGV